MGKFFKNAGLFLMLSVIMLLICTACSKNGGGILAKSPELNMPFESEMKIQAGELELTGNVKRYGTGLWEMNVTSPETLAGLSLSYNDDGVKANLGGLALDVPMEDINNGAVFSLIFKAIDNAAAAGALSCSETEDGMVYSGEFPLGAYSITFDPETLAPVKMEIPSAQLFGEFENFVTINAETETTAETTAESN